MVFRLYEQVFISIFSFSKPLATLYIYIYIYIRLLVIFKYIYIYIYMYIWHTKSVLELRQTMCGDPNG